VRVEVAGAAVPRLSRREIAAFARRVLRACGTGSQPVRIDELSIAFVDDATIRALNRKFRRKNDQARRQARNERHSLATEVRYLIAHGVLHALGYDHEADRGEMNALELRVRERVGLM